MPCCRRIEDGVVTLIGATTEDPYYEVELRPDLAHARSTR